MVALTSAKPRRLTTYLTGRFDSISFIIEWRIESRMLHARRGLIRALVCFRWSVQVLKSANVLLLKSC